MCFNGQQPGEALQVRDSRGSFVLSGKNTGNLDISDLPSGIYHMQISHGTTVERATFLKR
ncbi:MAG: T9SS type A sorting domain-containing protein [Flavobacteriales bacterium]|nr:T9SS type A sorting domain-containing protein [Flavobacteriales bacterium]